MTEINLTMFGILKRLFGFADDGKLKSAINKGAFLADVRSPSEFSKGSVEGAVNIPLDDVQDELPKFKDKGSIIVFCQSGGRSRQAQKILENNGFQNVLNGGSWKNVKRIKNE